MKRWIPMDRYHISGLEAWLSDLAKEGWKLQKMGRFFAYFEKKEEKRFAYHIEIKAEEEREEELKADGWEYISDMGKNFAVYGSKRKTLKVPAYSQEAIKRLKKEQLQVGSRAVWMLLLLIFLIALGYQLYAQEFVMCTLDDAMMGLYLLLMIYNIQEMGLALRRRRFLKHLQEGKATATSKRHTTAAVCLILTGLLVAEGSLWGIRALQSWQGDIAQADIVYTSLEELESTEVSGEVIRKEFGNTAKFSTSFLVPVQYELRQSGHTASGSEPALQMKYDEAVNEMLASKLLKARVVSMLRWNESIQAQEAEIMGAEEAYVASYQSMQYLFMRQGSKVLSVFYMGNQDLAERASAFLKMFNQKEASAAEWRAWQDEIYNR